MTNRILTYGVVMVAVVLAACSSDDSISTSDGGVDGAAGNGGSDGGGVDGARTDAAIADQASQDGDAAQDGAGDGSTDVSLDGANGDAGDASDATAEGEGGTAFAYVRLAHLSPDAPAVDFCLRARTADGGIADAGGAAADAGGFGVGPVLKGLGVTAGLTYAQISSYVQLAPGSYDVRVVAPNAADCSTPLAGFTDTSDSPQLTAGAYFTIAALGLTTPDAGPPFLLRVYADERTVTNGKTKVRFLHASPGTSTVNAGFGTGESFVAVFTNVPYTGASTGTGINANGYLETAPVANQTIVVRTAANEDALAVPGISLPAGWVASVFAIGLPGSTVAPLSALVCQDLDNSKAPLSNCSALP